MPVIEHNRIYKHILWAKINRPEARNAIDFDVMEALENLIESIREDECIRMFILSGAGNKAFVAGGDLKKFHSITSHSKAAVMAKRMHRILLDIENLPCWTAACINGDAYGGGTELMLAFDFRLAREGVKLGFTQGRFNLSPGWGGLTRLIETAGRAKAMEWLGSQRIISPQEAREFDLINAILPHNNFEKEMLEWGNSFTANNRSYIQTLKAAAQYNAELRLQALNAEIEPFARLWTSQEHMQKVAEFIKGNA